VIAVIAMRAFGFDRLLAGTVLALIAAAPGIAAATPQEAEAVAPATVVQANAGTAAVDIKGTLKPPVPIDTQIADRLREIVDAKAFERRFDSEPEREAVTAFYAGRGYAALWITDGRPNARAEAAMARLKNADADGLEAKDFLVPRFGALADAELLADADIELTTSLLAFARQLAVGRLTPARVLGEVDYGNHAPAPTPRAPPPIYCVSSRRRAMKTPRSKASIRRMPASRRSRQSLPHCAPNRNPILRIPTAARSSRG